MFRATPLFATATAVTIAMLAAGCERVTALEEIPAGSRVTIETADGREIEGKLIDVTSDRVVVQSDASDSRRVVSRSAVAEVRRGVDFLDLLPATPEMKEVTIPAETVIPIELDTTLTSAANRTEDPVRAHTREPALLGDAVALPAGSELRGTVTSAKASGDVKGRAQLSLRFDEIAVHGEFYDMTTAPLVYEAHATKKEDAKKIGVGAAAGAIIGGLTGGKKGAAIGSAIGGGAGTAVVMTTPGEEIELLSGTNLQVRLRQPLTIRVPRSDR